MTDSLLDQMDTLSETSLRPVMHNIKVISPLIAAISTRKLNGQRCQEILNLTSQMDGLINSVLIANKLPAPGQEWLRATIRTALLPLIVEDIKKYGDIKADAWLEDFVSLSQNLQIQTTEITPQNSQATQVKLAIADATTQLLKATQDFSFLHHQSQLVSKLIKVLFNDAKTLCDRLGNQFTPDKGNLMTNFLKNHTVLMISAIQSEAKRLEPILTQETMADYSDGLPLDGLFDEYKKLKSVLVDAVPELHIENNQQSSTFAPLPAALKP